MKKILMAALCLAGAAGPRDPADSTTGDDIAPARRHGGPVSAAALKRWLFPSFAAKIFFAARWKALLSLDLARSTSSGSS